MTVSVIPFPDTVLMGKAGRPPVDAETRFWAKVDASGDCWIWTGANFKGYGQFRVNPKGDRTRAFAHRFAWESLVGPLPQGMQLDHLCRNPSCVNPDHLEPVDQATNIGRIPLVKARRRSLTCKHGHEWTAYSTITLPRGYRRCRLCLYKGQGWEGKQHPSVRQYTRRGNGFQS